MDVIISFIADALVVPIVVLAAFFVLRLPAARRWQAVARGGITALTALWFAKLIAQFYQGQRPFEALGVDPKASYLPNPGFPSDHALLVFTAAIVTYAATRNKWLGLVLLALAVAVSSGRVLALVHTVPDVLGGAACALVAGLIWYGPRLQQTYFGSAVKPKASKQISRK